MSEHTPGKLYLSDNYAWPEIRTEDGDKLVAVCQGEVRSGARRLVACWNACEGISTEILEEVNKVVDVAPGLVSAYLKSSDEFDAIKDECDSLRAVNAELLEALKDAATSLETINRLAGKSSYGVDEDGPIPTYMGHHDEVRGYAGSRAGVARAAIASARKQENHHG